MISISVISIGNFNAQAGYFKNDSYYTVATDDDYVYVAGYTSSFGSGGEDVLVQKYSKSTGALQWTRIWGGRYDDRAYSLVLDNEGGIYITGTTNSFSTTPAASNVFILKVAISDGTIDTSFYDRTPRRNGYIIWGETQDESGSDEGRGITIDTAADPEAIYVTGTTGGCSWPGNQPSAFILKYDNTGANSWDNFAFDAVIWDPFSGDQDIHNDYGCSIACKNNDGGGDDRIYVTGYTQPPNSNGYYKCFLLCYNEAGSPVTNGNFVNGYLLFGISNVFNYAYSLFYDKTNGKLYVVGENNGFGYPTVYFYQCDAGTGYNYGSCSWDIDYSCRGNSIWYDGTYIWITGDAWGDGFNGMFIGQCDSSGSLNTEWPVPYDFDHTSASGKAITVGSNIFVAGFVSDVYTDTMLGKFSTDDGQSVNYWPKIWDDRFDDYTLTIAVTNDAYYIAGYTYSYDDWTTSDAFVAKYNLNGVLQWWQLWDNGGNDIAYSIAVTDSAVFIAGSTETGYPTYLAGFIMKYDLNGNGLQFHSSSTGYVSQQNTPDAIYGITIKNGILFCTGYCTVQGIGGTSKDILLIDSDLAGATVNEYSSTFLAPNNDDIGYSIAVDGSNPYVAGSTSSKSDPNGGGGVDALLVKFSNLQSDRFTFPIVKVWDKEYGGTSEDCAYSVDVDNNGNGNVYWSGYKTAYVQQQPPYYFKNSFVGKYMKDGTFQWMDFNAHVNNDKAYSLRLHGNNLYVAGYEDKYGSGSNDIYLRKFNLDGSKAWQTYLNDAPYTGMETWGGSADDTGRAIAVSDDIYTAGWTKSYGPGDVNGGYNAVSLTHSTDGDFSNYEIWS